MRKQHVKDSILEVEGEVSANQETPIQASTGITRREFLVGTAAVSIIASGSSLLVGCSSASSSEDESQLGFETTEIVVPESKVISSSDFEELSFGNCASYDDQFKVPMGSILHMDSDALAIIISPGDANNVLTKLGFLIMSNGNTTYFLDNAVSADEGYVIYDARGNGEVVIWDECNLRTNEWRTYIAAVTSSASIGEAVLVDEGDSDFDPPMLCVCGNKAYWTVMPNPNGEASKSDSYLKTANINATTAQIVYTSHGRMITNPQASDGIVTFVPRADVSTVKYQLTALDSATDKVIAAQTLPKSMKVNTALYLNETFVFGIESTYDYGDGISNFGTYTDTGDGKYMRFNRTPVQPPAWVGKYIVIKSTKSIVALDMKEKQYFAIDTIKGCESYGDFLLSTGTSSRIVTYTSVPYGDGSGRGSVRVRVFSVL